MDSLTLSLMLTDLASCQRAVRMGFAPKGGRGAVSEAEN